MEETVNWIGKASAAQDASQRALKRLALADELDGAADALTTLDAAGFRNAITQLRDEAARCRR